MKGLQSLNEDREFSTGQMGTRETPGKEDQEPGSPRLSQTGSGSENAHQQNRDLDMFINASKNFNLNITWAASFSGKEALPSGDN